MSEVQVNTRFLAHELTGVQRYTCELMARLGDRLDPVAPQPGLAGIRGHLWEQFVLPFQVDERLFWNPTCPGPVFVSRQVITLHDLSVIDHPEWFDWKYTLWNRMLIPVVLRRARHVIAVSHATKQRAEALYGVPSEKVSVVYNGVDRRFAPQSPTQIERVRTAVGIPAGPYVLSLSALEPRKNLERLLAAWRGCRDAVPDPPTLVLAGGAGRPTIFHNFSLDDVPEHVHFTGYVDDDHLPGLYSGAQAFVYPSVYEGFGLPLLEAMSCGTAVATSNVTSMPEVAGEAALLFDPYDVGSIEAQLRRLLADETLRADLEERGRSQAAKFRWDRTSEETWDVLRRFVK